MNIDISKFPILKPKSFIYIDVEKTKVGRMVGDFFYKKDADVFISSMRDLCNVRKGIKEIPAEKCIADFYFWDTRLDKFRDNNQWVAFLNEISGMGFKRLVGLDFSIFAEPPIAQALYNFWMAGSRMKTSEEMGFTMIFNMSHGRMDLFPEAVLHTYPRKIPTVVFDCHTLQPGEIKIIAKTTEIFFETHEVKSASLQVSTKNISVWYPILKLLKKYEIPHVNIPSHTTMFQEIIKSQKKRGA